MIREMLKLSISLFCFTTTQIVKLFLIPVGTREPSPTALALGFNVSRIYFACCKYAGNLYPAYLQHAFVYCMMSPKAKAIGLVSIVPVGRKDIHYYPRSESISGPVWTREPSPTALALGFNVSRIYFACCKYVGYRFPAYLQHAFVLLYDEPQG